MSAVNVRSVNNVKQENEFENDTQRRTIKNLLHKWKSEPGVIESDNLMPEMVGYQSDTPMLVAPIFHPTQDAVNINVRKLVCSPDIPISEYPPKTLDTTGHTTIRCQICHKVYESKTAFQAHQRTHAKEMEDPYRCNICSKTFAVPARLTRHYRTHTGEKPFRCEFCNKSFSVKENLSVHRRIHTKERPYKCAVCSRAFEHSGKLHRHMRIHTGERPHKCSICSKTFIQSGQLVIHMRTHTGEKPYVCTVCQKGFTCSKQLKVHSRTHTGEKPYSCEICGKSFGYNHVLKLHQVAHFGEKVYKCTICNDTFNSKKTMEAHIKSHSENGVSNQQHPLQPPTPPASSSSSESSCSSTSDKENTMKEVERTFVCDSSSPSSLGSILYNPDRMTPVYIQSNYHIDGGVELLAAAASATESMERYKCPDVVFNLSNAFKTPYFPTTPTTLLPLSNGDEIRRRLEAALAVDLVAEEERSVEVAPKSLTPPLSRPMSPVRVESPDPELSLPPRKRSRMIQKSIEATSIDLSRQVRYSVIQYARAT